jgi:hypothetical protein
LITIDYFDDVVDIVDESCQTPQACPVPLSFLFPTGRETILGLVSLF